MGMGSEGEEERRNDGLDCVLQPHLKQMEKSREQFKSGDQVEASFERDEKYGVWFPGTVKKYLSDDDCYSVQHWYKKDGTARLVQKSKFPSSKIHPQCLQEEKRRFRLSDTVDAFHDFAWTPGVIVKDFNNKKFMVSFKRTENKMVFSDTKLRFHMDWVDGRWVDTSQAMVADNDDDMPHPRPSKKSKAENAEVPTMTACKNDDVAKETKQGQSETPTSIVNKIDETTPKRPCEMPISSVGEKVTKGKSVKGLKRDNAKSLKRKGTPEKLSPLSSGGNESNEVARVAEDTDKKGCETKVGKDRNDIAPIIPGIAEKLPNNSPDPSQLVIKDKGENVKELENKSGERPQKNCQSSSGGNESNTGVKMELVARNNLALALLELSQTSITDPSPLLIEENPKKNQREISTNSSENTDMELDANQPLPFERTSLVWDTLESMEVFKSMPQNPHFLPLESNDEDCREGLALAHMMTFFKIASKIPELKLNTPKSSIESSLKILGVLEQNGFDVKLIRECLYDVLLKKDKIDKLQNNLKDCDNEISEYKSKKADISKVVEEYDKILEEIRAKRHVAVLEMEVQESRLARSRSTRDEINEQMMTIELDFEKTVVLPVCK